jgi:hypothetical protein
MHFPGVCFHFLWFSERRVDILTPEHTPKPTILSLATSKWELPKGLLTCLPKAFMLVLLFWRSNTVKQHGDQLCCLT